MNSIYFFLQERWCVTPFFIKCKIVIVVGTRDPLYDSLYEGKHSSNVCLGCLASLCSWSLAFVKVPAKLCLQMLQTCARWATFDFNWDAPPFLALAAFSAFLALAMAVFCVCGEREWMWEVGVNDGRCELEGRFEVEQRVIQDDHHIDLPVHCLHPFCKSD